MPTPIPTKAEFQKATELKFVVSEKRGADVTLQHIDGLLDDFHATPDDEEAARIILLGRLYYGADAWLKKADRGGHGINTRRKPAVDTFYRNVVHRLSEATKVSINLLPEWLAETFGKALGAHGVDLDIDRKLAEYLTEAQVAKYRLDIRGGVVYQQAWWRNSTKWVRASSGQVLKGTMALRATQGKPDEVITPGFSGYVMSQGGDLYCGPHFVPDKKGSARYHSSYYGGEPVLSAGEIKLEDGRLVEINNGSGHYQPGVEKLVLAVEMLAIVGVCVADLQVSAFGVARMSGTDFLRTYLGRLIPATTRGNSLLTQANRAATVTRHNASIEMEKAFTLFKSHWKPKAAGGHGPGGAEKCKECKDFERFWQAFLDAINRSTGGMATIPVRVIRPAMPSFPP